MTKNCISCQTEKNSDLFFNKKDAKDGKFPYCKDCCKKKHNDFYAKNPTNKLTYERNKVETLERKQQKNEYSKSYRKINPHVYVFHEANRRALLKKCTPKWLTDEQLAEIKEIYRNCPQGHEVDHIIPLRAMDPLTKEVMATGLHVPWNLQYLTVSINRRKKNRVQSTIHTNNINIGAS